MGRRTSKTVSAVVTNYLYDGNQAIAEYDASGTLLRRYVYGPGIGRRAGFARKTGVLAADGVISTDVIGLDVIG